MSLPVSLLRPMPLRSRLFFSFHALISPTSDVPHRKDDAVDVVQRHQWLGLAVRDVTTSWSVLLEAWTTLRTLGGGDIFMCSGTIGGCNSDFAD